MDLAIFIALGTIVAAMILLCTPPIVRALSVPSTPPPRELPSGARLAAWTFPTTLTSFAEGREATCQHVTLKAVSGTECHFGFKHMWSAGDLGWPIQFSLAGSLRLEAGALKVEVWTSRSVYGAMALAIVGVVVACVGVLLQAATLWDWRPLLSGLWSLFVFSIIVGSWANGARRFGQEGARCASSVAPGV